MRQQRMAILLAGILTCLLLFSASAAETTLMVRPPGDPVKAGEEFEVMVEIAGNPGFYSAQCTLTFDHDKMTCGAIELGEAAKGMLSVFNPDGPRGAMVSAASSSELRGDGTLASFYFLAKEDMETFSFSLTEVEFGNQWGKPIPCTLLNVVEEPEPEQSPPSSGNSGAEGPSETETGGGSSSGSSSGDSSSDSQWESSSSSQEQQTAAVAELPNFSDIGGHWGESFIREAAAQKLFNGYPDGRFGPDDQVTRAQFVTVLYRLAGSPSVAGEAPFTDVSAQGQEFQRAIAWAAQKGYISGKGDGTFDPDGSLTREAAMKILFFYDGGKTDGEGLLTSVYDDSFVDSGDISPWAKPAMYWGYYNKLINGTGGNALSPQGTATRSQLAKILINYLEEVT